MAELQANSVGEYIAQRRTALRLTQVDLMNRLAQLGIERKPTTIASWETGQNPVPVELMPPLAEALEEPNPATLYELAGILDNIPGSEIVKLLRDRPQEEIDRAERILRELLKTYEKK